MCVVPSTLSFAHLMGPKQIVTNFISCVWTFCRAPEVENDTAKIKVRTSKRIDDIPITVEIMSDLVL
jgi:hypothetical protein